MKPYGQQHYSRVGKNRIAGIREKLSPTAAEQLRRMLRTRGVYGAARLLGVSPTLLERADLGTELHRDACQRLSALLEKHA